MSRSNNGERRRRIAATIAFFSEAVRFIIIPLILVELVLGQFPIFTPQMADRIAGNIIIFGGFVALFSALEAYFPKHSPLKMLFGILSIATLCVWFWSIFSGDRLEFTYSAVTISIDVQGIVLLIIIAISLKALLYIFRYFISVKAKKLEEEKARRQAERKYMDLMREPEIMADDVIHEASFLYWAGGDDLEPPPPEDAAPSCPICLRELPEGRNECPECGAWVKRSSDNPDEKPDSASDLVE